MRSTPIARLSSSEKFFECFARTGVNTPPRAKMTDDGVLGRNLAFVSPGAPRGVIIPFALTREFYFAGMTESSFFRLAVRFLIRRQSNGSMASGTDRDVATSTKPP